MPAAQGATGSAARHPPPPRTLVDPGHPNYASRTCVSDNSPRPAPLARARRFRPVRPARPAAPSALR
ncbi:unnamed protein product [[Actinomadura] parvosata subsp. kistnae]|nr:unnamed protein product [Actinomadura parvosata subsp. kistnae]